MKPQNVFLLIVCGVVMFLIVWAIGGCATPPVKDNVVAGIGPAGQSEQGIVNWLTGWFKGASAKVEGDKVGRDKIDGGVRQDTEDTIVEVKTCLINFEQGGFLKLLGTIGFTIAAIFVAVGIGLYLRQKNNDLFGRAK